MAAIPFTKAQAVGNDFLIVERDDLARLGIGDEQLPELARRICDRRLGMGADGLEVVGSSSEAAAAIHLWNSDGTTAEISGNGTRCVAAYLTARGAVEGSFTLATGAGVKRLELTASRPPEYRFRMAMGEPSYTAESIHAPLTIDGEDHPTTIVNVGNPQCALFVEDFEFDWRKLAPRVERHARFPSGSNVSFVRVIDRHTIDVRFWERGVGETMSSGTGATGAAVAGIISGRIESPVAIRTAAGEMMIEWTDDVYLSGAARLIASGIYEM